MIGSDLCPHPFDQHPNVNRPINWGTPNSTLNDCCLCFFFACYLYVCIASKSCFWMTCLLQLWPHIVYFSFTYFILSDGDFAITHTHKSDASPQWCVQCDQWSPHTTTNLPKFSFWEMCKPVKLLIPHITHTNRGCHWLTKKKTQNAMLSWIRQTEYTTANDTIRMDDGKANIFLSLLFSLSIYGNSHLHGLYWPSMCLARARAIANI